MNYKKISMIVIVVLVVIIQFFRIDKSTPETDQKNDYLTFTNAPQEIATILKESCYDCHSYKTDYPWYSNIAPISWFLQSHISEARDNINLSLWGEFSKEKKISIKQGIIGVIEDNEMPLKSYTLIHTKAKLTDEEQAALVDWFSIPESE